jgi:hypothetical protein
MIFVGPTLAPAEIEAAGTFVHLPPVAQGDVYRAVPRGARAIGIVDGFFLRRALRLAQGDFVGDGRGRAGVRQRQYGGAAGGRTLCLRQCAAWAASSKPTATGRLRTTMKSRSYTVLRISAIFRPPNPWSTSAPRSKRPRPGA